MSKSFQQDILPLFRQRDILCMGNMNVLLNDYSYMSNPAGDAIHHDYANARHIFAHLKGDEQPRMPPGGPYWPDEKLNILYEWINSGCAP